MNTTSYVLTMLNRIDAQGNALASSSESDKSVKISMRQRIRNPRSNVPVQNLKWSLDRASREFRLAQNTLRKYLHQSDAEPDEGGCYTTMQIVDAVFGDLRAQKLKKEKELTKKYQLENAITEGTVLDRAALAHTFGLIADAMVSRINAAVNVPRSVRDDLLHDLATWPDAIKEVADKQSRLPRGNRDGEDGEEDDD
jgi:hypothetical protein